MHPQPWDAFAGEQNGVPKGNRTPVAGMKTRCPGPLDEGVI